MGSEGPLPGCVLHVTGFKKFHGVDENPTEVIALSLENYIEKRGLPQGVKLGSVTILETAGDGALAALHKLLDSALPSEHRDSSDADLGDRIIWVHMGVNSGASKFAIERKAVNEATFRCPDEMGWQPQRLPIILEDGALSHVRETTFPVPELVDSLVKKGFNVALSDDAGRFVCNYVYYHSLCHAAAHRTKCLFVHVPPFSKVEAEKQIEFMASLFDTLSSMC
eukprot:c24224_g1_i2 orf=119-790(+)